MLDILHSIDKQVFLLLNGSFLDHPLLQSFWGLVNHKLESTLNLLMAFMVNVVTLLCTRDPKLRKIRFYQFLYFWSCFQIGFLLQNWFFHSYLEIKRLSPSLVITPAYRLSKLLNNPLIKDFSEFSFPSGHAFAMIYWASFTYLCSPKKVGILALCLGIFFCLPRLVSGAHWLSDVAFSVLMALAWLGLTVRTPLYRFLERKYKWEVKCDKL